MHRKDFFLGLIAIVGVNLYGMHEVYSGEEWDRTKRMGREVGRLIERGVERCGNASGYQGSKNCAGKILERGLNIPNASRMIEGLDRLNKTPYGPDNLSDYQRAQEMMKRQEPLREQRNRERINSLNKFKNWTKRK